MTKTFKNCQLKGLILRSILDGTTTAPLIAQDIKYPHSYRDSFFRELKFLKDSGYVSRKKESGTTVYSLTKKGKQHAETPFLFVYQKRERINTIVQQRVNGVLMKDEEFNKAVEKMANQIASHPVVNRFSPKPDDIVVDNIKTEYVPLLVPVDIGEKPESVDLQSRHTQPTQSTQQSPIPNSETVESPEFLKDKIAKLEQQVTFWKNKRTAIVYDTKYIDSATGQPVDPEVMSKTMEKRNKQRIVQTSKAYYRKGLANKYRGYLLDANFFHAWGNAEPVKLKNVPWYQAGSIEIVSSRNSEFDRGHVERKLTSQQIHDAKFCIQVFKEGIEVGGKGMAKPKFMKY